MSEKAKKHRLLVFDVEYNAETTLLEVLDRIPDRLLETYDTEVLVIDDASRDKTFEIGRDRALSSQRCKLTVLQNPVNQGYGGNQKLGYEYAMRHGFDSVALLHGDGQYAPEKLPELIGPIAAGDADAVFGTRMAVAGDALKGGMPLYKYAGNKILTAFQNAVLGTKLSEFHSGFRAYSVAALRDIPFQFNSNDFHFDTEIIVQLVLGKYRIREIPMPTYYGDEVCYVNGTKYAKDVVVATLASRAHQAGLKYQRKYDVERGEEPYDIKLGYPSSHTAAIDAVPEGARVLDLGCGPGLVGRELKRKGCTVVGLDVREPNPENMDKFIQWDLNDDAIPEEVFEYEYILLLDIIEHLRNPERFVDMLRRGARTSRPTIILTTANVTFLVPRLMFLAGQFNYGKRGILDKTHTRLFTFYSMKHLLEQSGYEIVDVKGIPAPFPKALGDNRIGRDLLRINEALIRLSKPVFSYQMYFAARPLPTVDNLLDVSIGHSESRSSNQK